MINIEYEELIGNLNALNEEIRKDINLPVRLSLTIIKNMKLMAAALEPYQEVYNNIIHRYAPLGELSKDAPEYSKCVDELKQLGDEKADLDLKLIDPADIEDLTLPVSFVRAITIMLKED